MVKIGKAAIFVAPVTIVVVGLIIWGIIRTAKKPSANVKKLQGNAQLAESAMELFRSLMIVDSLDGDMDILSERSKKKIKMWVEQYRKVNS